MKDSRKPNWPSGLGKKIYAFLLIPVLVLSVLLVETGCSQKKKPASKKKELTQAGVRRILDSSIKAMSKVKSFKCNIVEIEVVKDESTATTSYLEWSRSGSFYEKDSTGREYYLVGDVVFARETTSGSWQQMVIPKGKEDRYRVEKRLPAMPLKVIDDLRQGQNFTDLGVEKVNGQKCWVFNFLFKPESEHAGFRSAETVWISQSSYLVLKFERSWKKTLFESGSISAAYSDYNRPFKIAVPKELDLKE